MASIQSVRANMKARRAVLVLLLLATLLPLDHCRDVPTLPEKSSNAGPESIECGSKFAACYPTNCDTGDQCFCCKFAPGSACYPTEGECRDHCHVWRPKCPLP